MMTLRVACLTKFNVSEKQVADLNNNYYIDNDESDLKVILTYEHSHLKQKMLKYIFTLNKQCYVNCILENFGLMKKGKMNYNFSVKRIKTFVPLELQDLYIKAMDGCRDVGQATFKLFSTLLVLILLIIPNFVYIICIFYLFFYALRTKYGVM